MTERIKGKVRANIPMYYHGNLYPQGAEFDYDGPPSRRQAFTVIRADPAPDAAKPVDPQPVVHTSAGAGEQTAGSQEKPKPGQK